MWKNIKKKFNKKNIQDNMDWIVISFAVFSLICNLIPTKNECFNNSCCIIAGIIGLYYFFAAIPFIWNGPKFDWNLVNGHFLRKVFCFILLTPFLLTVISTFFINSPKELVFEENLYECRDNKLSCVIKHKQESPNLFWSTYYHFIDPGNQHMTTSQSGRGWSALIAILGVFLLNGVLVSSIVGWIDSRKEKWLKGDVKYDNFLKRNKHYIIIGGNDMAFGIVRHIFEKEKTSENTKSNKLPYIVIQTSLNVEDFRRNLFSILTEQQQQHTIILYGNRTSKVDLDNLSLNNAEEIYILGESNQIDEAEPYHDSINMQCLDCIKKIRSNNKTSKAVDCYVMFEYQTTFAAFQASKQKREIEGDIIFIPFNTHETWAQKVLVCGKAKTIDGKIIKYNNIDKDGINATSENFVHMIIVGMSKIGTAMAIETAHVAHFPNYINNSKKRTKITFIDINAREESDFFRGRFSDLFKLCKWTDVDGNIHNDRFPGDIKGKCGETPKKNEYSYFDQNFIDIEFEFREGGVETRANRDYLINSIENENAIVTIAVCLPLPHQSIAAALYLPHDVIEKANDIWVYQPQSAKLMLDITKQQENIPYWKEVKYKKLKPFGMQDGSFDEKLINNELVTYCRRFYDLKEELKKESPKYDEWTCNIISQKYEEISTTQVEKPQHIWDLWSNIYHLNTLYYKLRSIKEKRKYLTELVESNRGLIAKVEHNRWNVEKLLMGYRPLRDRLIKNEDEIKQIVKFLSTENASGESIEKIKLGKQNERYIYISEKSIKKYYKDGPQKIHPNICPYDDIFLPNSDKEYDICFTLALPFFKNKFKQYQKN